MAAVLEFLFGEPSSSTQNVLNIAITPQMFELVKEDKTSNDPKIKSAFHVVQQRMNFMKHFSTSSTVKKPKPNNNNGDRDGKIIHKAKDPQYSNVVVLYSNPIQFVRHPDSRGSGQKIRYIGFALQPTGQWKQELNATTLENASGEKNLTQLAEDQANADRQMSTALAKLIEHQQKTSSKKEKVVEGGVAGSGDDKKAAVASPRSRDVATKPSDNSKVGGDPANEQQSNVDVSMDPSKPCFFDSLTTPNIPVFTDSPNNNFPAQVILLIIAFAMVWAFSPSSNKRKSNSSANGSNMLDF